MGKSNGKKWSNIGTYSVKSDRGFLKEKLLVTTRYAIGFKGMRVVILRVGIGYIIQGQGSSLLRCLVMFSFRGTTELATILGVTAQIDYTHYFVGLKM